MLDPEIMLRVRLYAAMRAEERVPRTGRHRLIDFMTRDDYRHGIRRTFADADGFDEWMVTPLLREFDEAETFEADVQAFAEQFLGSILGNAFAGFRRDVRRSA